MWNIQAADLMKVQQDNVKQPLSLVQKQNAVNRLKELGCTHVPVSVPYDTPSGAPDVITQIGEWVAAIKAAGLKTWHRHSWLSDEGFYDVARNTGSNNRIADTVKWIKDHPTLFQAGDIFTPKPEPQNCRVIGINWGDAGSARFKSVVEFNKWIRDMATACRAALNEVNLPTIKVGYWGFDGFVVCGYNNPDWQGKSFLELLTVQQMEDGIACDHYPPSGTTMAHFLQVYKQVWPGKKLIIGEYGAKGTDATSNKAQINEVFTTLKNDPIVIGVNYWPAVGGIDGPLLDGSFAPILGFDTVKGYFTQGIAPTPDPVPTPTPTPTPVPEPAPVSLELGPSEVKESFRELKINGVSVGKIKLYH